MNKLSKIQNHLSKLSHKIDNEKRRLARIDRVAHSNVKETRYIKNIISDLKRKQGRLNKIIGSEIYQTIYSVNLDM